MPLPDDHLYLSLAVAQAQPFIGATAPNPPVGACIVKDGLVLAAGGHARAGLAHAERVALSHALETYGEAALRDATLYVTLEPCNHFGKTSPCTEAILKAGIKRVVFGSRDPNPNVAGHGRTVLNNAGVSVVEVSDHSGCRELVRDFEKWAVRKLPWVVHKLAYRAIKTTSGSSFTMLPEGKLKTFTGAESLKEAHLERRKADAIITGFGTVIADRPLFNVRNVQDHEGKIRFLAVLSKSGQNPPADWVARQQELGFKVIVLNSIAQALTELAGLGAHRVLVEAGPTLSQAVFESGLWDERLLFFQQDQHDRILREYNTCSQA